MLLIEALHGLLAIGFMVIQTYYWHLLALCFSCFEFEFVVVLLNPGHTDV